MCTLPLSSAVSVSLEEETYQVKEDGGYIQVCAQMEGESEMEVVVALTTEDGSAQGIAQ